MTEIYIAFVDTPGIFASIIRRVIKQKYIHVAIGLDENLDEAYSIGRRHPSIPLIAGFEKEEKRKRKLTVVFMFSFHVFVFTFSFSCFRLK